MENESPVSFIPVKFEKIVQSKTYCSIVLAGPEVKFAIYTDLSSGKTLQMMLTNTKKNRPSSHDLLNLIFQGLETKVRQVVINDLQGTIYFSRLFLEQQRGDILHIVEIDARPSDCITLALLNKAPIYCTDAVLKNVVPVVGE